MAFPHKIITFCICLMLASFGILVEGLGGMMGGMLGGGGGHKHGGGGSGLEALLAAGILAKLLRSHGHGGHGHKGHSHGGHGGHGGHGQGRSAGLEMYGMPYGMPYGMEMGMGYELGY